MDTVVQIAVFLGIFTTVIISGSRNDGDFIMGLLNILLFYTFSSDGDGILELCHQEVLREMWGNINSVLSKFDFQSKTTIYAVCPKCHCTYAPLYNHGDSTPQYPSHCTHSPNAELGPCGAKLLSNSKASSSSKPIKPLWINVAMTWMILCALLHQNWYLMYGKPSFSGHSMVPPKEYLLCVKVEERGNTLLWSTLRACTFEVLLLHMGLYCLHASTYHPRFNTNQSTCMCALYWGLTSPAQ